MQTGWQKQSISSSFQELTHLFGRLSKTSSSLPPARGCLTSPLLLCSSVFPCRGLAFAWPCTEPMQPGKAAQNDINYGKNTKNKRGKRETGKFSAELASWLPGGLGECHGCQAGEAGLVPSPPGALCCARGRWAAPSVSPQPHHASARARGPLCDIDPVGKHGEGPEHPPQPQPLPGVLQHGCPMETVFLPAF